MFSSNSYGWYDTSIYHLIYKIAAIYMLDRYHILWTAYLSSIFQFLSLFVTKIVFNTDVKLAIEDHNWGIQLCMMWGLQVLREYVKSDYNRHPYTSHGLGKAGESWKRSAVNCHRLEILAIILLCCACVEAVKQWDLVY